MKQGIYKDKKTQKDTGAVTQLRQSSSFLSFTPPSAGISFRNNRPAATQVIQRQPEDAIVPALSYGGMVSNFVGNHPYLSMLGASIGLGTMAYKLYSYLTAPDVKKDHKLKFNLAKKPGTFNSLKSRHGKDPKYYFDTSTKEVYTLYNHQQFIEQEPDVYGKDLIKDYFGEDEGLTIKVKFANTYGSTAYKSDLKSKEKSLFRRSKKFKNLDYYLYDKQEKEWGQKSKKQISSDPTLGRRGVLLGEDHNNPEHRAFISRNMEALKEKGINVIYLEHFRDEHQEDIDNYLKSWTGRMSPNLDLVLKGLDKKYEEKDTMRYLLQKARALRMRVVGIDSMAAQAEDTEVVPGYFRNSMMNQESYDRILNDQKKHGSQKYLALVGGAHVHSHPSTKESKEKDFKKGFPGLSEMLSIPAYHIRGNRMKLWKDNPKDRN